MDDTVARIRRAAAAVDPVICSVSPDQFTLPTPCEEWDVRALLDHLLSTLRHWTARLEGREAEAGSALDAAGDDVAAAWHASLDALLRAVAEPGALDREVPLPNGQRGSARFIAAIAPAELMLHGWDVARAVGASTDLDPELAEALLERARGLLQHSQRGAIFGQEQPAPEDATAADRLAAFYGRRVQN